LSENSGKLFLEAILKVVRAYIVKKTPKQPAVSATQSSASSQIFRTPSIEEDARYMQKKRVKCKLAMIDN